MSATSTQAYALYPGDGKPQIHTFNIPISYLPQHPQRRGSFYSTTGSDSDGESASSQDTVITEPDSESPLNFSFTAGSGPSSVLQPPATQRDAQEVVKAELQRLETQHLNTIAASSAAAHGAGVYQPAHASQSAYLTQSAFKTFPPRRCGAFVGDRLPCSISRPNLPSTHPEGRVPRPQYHSSTTSQKGYAPHCPVGNHRAALSRLDSISQTQSLRFAQASVAQRSQTLHPLSFSQCPPPAQGQNATQPQHTHPRRSAPGQSWSAPSLLREEERRKLMVEQLVETASQLVATLWPSSETNPPESHPNPSAVICLRQFVRETLRRSRTSYNSLQLALFYLVKLRTKGKFSPCQSEDKSSEKGVQLAMQCGRRMMLTSLILAAKYLQDRNFSARAWNKISGLPVSEITANEIGVLKALNWELHVGEQEFSNWSIIVHRSTELVTSQRSSKELWRNVSKLHHDGKTIEQIARIVRPPPQLTIPHAKLAGTVALMHSPTAAGGLVKAESATPIDARVAPFATPVSMVSALSTPASQSCGNFGDMSSRTLSSPPAAPGLATTMTTPSFTPPSSQFNTSSPAVSAGSRSLNLNHTAQPAQILAGMGWMASPKSMGDSSPTSSVASASAASSFDLPPFDAASLAPRAAGQKRRAPHEDVTSCSYGDRSPVKMAKIDVYPTAVKV